jgi:hypothetical protein
VSKLSEIEARAPIDDNTGWNAKDSRQAFEDRRYLLRLVRECQRSLELSAEEYSEQRALLARLEE